MKRDDIYNQIEKYLPDLLGTLGDIVQIETPSHEDKAASDICCDYLQKLWSDIGFEMTRIHQDTCADDLYGEIGEGEKLALIVGHFDTVFPLGTLAKMPWKVEGDKAYGPGCLDMKGGIVMAYYAIRTLQDLGRMPAGKIGVYFDANEESGSFCSSDKIIEKAKQYGCALVMEPGVKSLGSIKTMRYGRGTYTVTAHGRSAHSGSNPKDALSPFLEIARQLQRLDQWMHEQEDVTYAPTVIRGGIDGTCVIPETASFTMDVRFRTQEAMDRAHEEILALGPILPGYTVTVEGEIDKPIMIGDETLYKVLESIAPDYDMELEPVACSGGSDGNFTAGGAHVPTLDGIGMSGEFLHTPEEYINVNHIVQRTSLFARLLTALPVR